MYNKRTPQSKSSTKYSEACTASSSKQQILSGLGLCFTSPPGAIRCIPCVTLLTPNSVLRHLSRFHKIRQAKKKLEKKKDMIPNEINSEFLEPSIEPIEPIEGN